jgi:hypothetical protein
MAKEKPFVDFSKMKIAGYPSTIEEVVERVFRPRKLSIDFRKKFSK